MRRIILLALTCLFFTTDSKGQLKKQIDSLNAQVPVLRNQIELFKELNEKQKEINENIDKRLKSQADQIESQTSLIGTSFDGVSAQLTASSNFIGIFGIAIAIFTTGLSIYVGRMARNVNQIRLDNESLLQRSIAIKEETEVLAKKIANNPRALLNLLRKEEAIHILDRLISVPEDISNMFSNLASAELDESHFLQMKEAYLQVSNEHEYAINYLTLFFQHFAGKSIIDPQIKVALLAELDTCIEMSFKNDIVKSTQDFFTDIHRVGLENSTNEVNTFAKSLGRSRYKDFEQVYFAVFNTIPSREQHFLLFRLIQTNEETFLFRRKYGELLLNYREDSTSEAENLVFIQIDNLTQ
jgi:hypothetical protein